MVTLEEIQEQINKIREQTAGLTTQAEALGATTLKTQQAVTPAQADANILAALTGGDTIPSAPTPILGEPPEERLITAQTTIDTATATGQAAAARATSESEFFKAQQQIFQEQQKELDAMEKKQSTFVDKFLNRQKVDIQAEREKLQQQFQIPELQQQITPLIADIGALNLQIANIEAQRQASLDASGERTGASLGFQTGEQKRINREFDRRTMAISAQVTAKTATVNMFRGELDSARGQIDNMIQAIQYDTQVARQDTVDYINFYENEISSLETDQRAIFEDMQTFWEDKAETETNELNVKRDLWLDAINEGAKWNVNPDDFQNTTIDEFLQMYGEQISRIPQAGIKVDTQIITLDDGTQALINSQTGEIINTFGGVGENIDTREFIDHPTRPGISIPNPNFGQPLGVDTIAVKTLSGKPLTDAQALSFGFGARMNNANAIISELGSQFTGAIGLITGSRFFPNIFKTEDRQRFEQAQRNFTNAVLRKESGAAIAPSEFESAAKQYFPQPGDSDAVLEQKAKNRQTVIANMARSANIPLSEITGQGIPAGVGGGSYQDYLNAIK